MSMMTFAKKNIIQHERMKERDTQKNNKNSAFFVRKKDYRINGAVMASRMFY